MRPKGSAEELERRRRRAVSLLEEEGHSQAEVARMVGSSSSSVCRWRKAARRKNGLAAKPHPGRPRRLTAAQHRRLARELAKGATAHGWPNDLWTASRATILVRRLFGVKYHIEHVRKILKGNRSRPLRRSLGVRGLGNGEWPTSWIQGPAAPFLPPRRVDVPNGALEGGGARAATRDDAHRRAPQPSMGPLGGPIAFLGRAECVTLNWYFSRSPLPNRHTR
jgi:transposase